MPENNYASNTRTTALSFALSLHEELIRHGVEPTAQDVVTDAEVFRKFLTDEPTTSVGTVGVKIVPDASGFGEALRNYFGSR